MSWKVVERGLAPPPWLWYFVVRNNVRSVMTDKSKDFADKITKAFAQAAKKVIKDVRAQGIPVYGTIGGKMVRTHPDGTIEEVDDEELWK